MSIVCLVLFVPSDGHKQLVDLIIECQKQCYQTYGYRRVKRWLATKKHIHVNLKAVCGLCENMTCFPVYGSSTLHELQNQEYERDSVYSGSGYVIGNHLQLFDIGTAKKAASEKAASAGRTALWKVFILNQSASRFFSALHLFGDTP